MYTRYLEEVVPTLTAEFGYTNPDAGANDQQDHAECWRWRSD